MWSVFSVRNKKICGVYLVFVSYYTTSRAIYINFFFMYPICRLCGDENEIFIFYFLINGEDESWSVDSYFIKV